jgi:hypothetical protein
MTGYLTAAEHDVIKALGDVWGDICKVVGTGPSRSADLSEVVFHVHALQHFVMAQAAARTYPDLYRLAGGATLGVDVDAQDVTGTNRLGQHRLVADHSLVADHNGEPSCVCGWTPHPPKYSTRMDAISGVHRHVATFIGMPS